MGSLTAKLDGIAAIAALIGATIVIVLAQLLKEGYFSRRARRNKSFSKPDERDT